MENINTTTQENINETTNDTVETVTDTVIDSCEDTVIHAIPEEDSGIGVVLGVAAVAVVGFVLYVAANWDDYKKKRYERKKAKFVKQAEKYGETVFVTKVDERSSDVSEEENVYTEADENK